MKPENPILTDMSGPLKKFVESVFKVLRGNIEFGDNIKGVSVSVTSPVAINTEFAVAHNLNYVPSNYIILSKNVAGDVYTSTGGTAWTNKNIYLKCTVASVALKIYVF